MYYLFIQILSYIGSDLLCYSEQKSIDDLHKSFICLTPLKLLFFFNLPAPTFNAPHSAY